MSLSIGSRLGPYSLVAEIGAGGMGHVFRAIDTRLDRAVAIKVLPQDRWSDPGFRQRFEREARALSSLSHPNLCALYDVGEISLDGANVPYLVMEMLDGETLRQRLDAGSLPFRKAMTWGAQIASGLAAAHDKGLVHRDLKPENIFVTRAELVKILDFGLAKGLAKGGGFSETAATAARTEPGMVMGTAHYMSPEQVRGETVDHRSDIFSLGVVLFEMLSGRVPFHARSPVETMSSILTDEPPDLEAIVPSIPPHVDEIVRRCLEKDPARRFASAHDLAFALENAARALVAPTPTPAKSPRVTRPVPARRTRVRLAVTGAILVAVVLIAALSRGVFRETIPEPPRLRTLTYSGRDGAPAASPDGRLVAFVSTRDGKSRIWLEQIVDGTEAALTAGPDDSAPRFLPDGSQVLFTRAEKGGSALYRVAVVGGDPRKMIDNAFDGDWSRDGRRIAFIRNRDEASERFSTVCIASADGGGVEEIFASSQEELLAPRWSPDGRWIAVTLQPHGTVAGSVMLVSPQSHERKHLVRDTLHGALSASAWVSRDAILYAESEQLTAGVLRRRGGGADIVLHDISSDVSRVVLRNPHAAADTVDVLGPGRIVFSEDFTRQNLQEVTLETGATRWLSHGMSMDRQPSYARDGKSIVFSSDRGGSVDVWELMLDSGTLRKLTDHSGVDWDPYPAADGKTLYWSSNRGGHFEIWSSTLDGTSPHQITGDGVDAENPSLPAQGDWIYYDSSNPESDGLWRIAPGAARPQLVVAGETIHPEVSADGAYAVYQRPEAEGPSAIDVVRIADGQVFTLVSHIPGVPAIRARWIGATHAISFRAPDESGRIALFAQDFVPNAQTRMTRRLLIDTDAVPETYAISPDGQHAILSVIDEASGVMVAEGTFFER